MWFSIPAVASFSRRSLRSEKRQESARAERSQLCRWWCLPPHVLARLSARDRRAIGFNPRAFVSIGDFDRDLSILTEAGTEMRISPRLHGLDIRVSYHHHPWTAPGPSTQADLRQRLVSWTEIVGVDMPRHALLAWSSQRPAPDTAEVDRYQMILNMRLEVLTPKAQISVLRPDLEGFRVLITPLKQGVGAVQPLVVFDDNLAMHRDIVEQARASDEALKRLASWKAQVLGIAVRAWIYRAAVWDDGVRAWTQLWRDFFHRRAS